MKWFSVKGIMEEMSKVRWPKASELASNSATAIIFTVLFACFFVLCDFIAAVVFTRFGM